MEIKSVALDPYNVAVIFLHPVCNMACTFCITEDNFDVMSQSQAVDLLRILKAKRFNTLVFGGGEPFEWPSDLVALTREAKELGFTVQVGTNAVALPDKFETIETIDRYVLPLESVDDRIHNQMRLYKNRHHEVIMSALDKLRKAQKSVTISTIITQVNKNGLKQLATYLNELDQPTGFIHAWHLYKFIPLGRGGGVNAHKLDVTDEEYRLACEDAKASNPAFPVYRRRNMYRSKTVDFFWYKNGQLHKGSDNRGTDPIARMTVPFADS